jgi:hypothetical protein
VTRALALTLGLLTLGCSTGQIRSHTTAARLSRSSLAASAASIDAVCSLEASARMARAGGTVADHERHIERCGRATSVYEVARQTWIGYVDAVLSAAAGERVQLSDLITWASRFATAYGAVIAMLGEWGVYATPLPQFLLSLTGSAQ